MRPLRRNTTASRTRPHRRLSPLAALPLAAALVMGGGACAATGVNAGGSAAKDGGSPPPLTLEGLTGNTPGAPAPPGIAPGEPDPHGVVYRAAGKLPAGPDTAPVHRAVGSVPAAEVARLARALGVAGTPREDATSWKVGADNDGSGPLLRVEKQAPGSWTFARFGASPRGDNCLKGKDCPSGGGGGGDESYAVGEKAAKQAAAPVLTAVGQQDAALDARQLMGAVRVVNADPKVGGLPTDGWSTGIEVGADGQVVGGSGQLKKPEKGAEYPVISADEALKALNGAGRRPMRPGGCATPVPLDRPAAPCEPAPAPAAVPMVIKSAAFGLAALSLDGRRALVPSWLFEVTPGGGALPYTVTQSAVDPRYVRQPAPPQPAPPPPGTPAAPAGPRVEAYSTAGTALSLRFWGGVCSDYTGHADEGGTAVKVRVTASAPEPKKVCPAIIKQQSVTVTLESPLGARPVVDAATGAKVPAA